MSRNYIDGDDVYRLYDYQKIPEGCQGALLRLKTDAPAQKIGLNNDLLEDVHLQPDEHLVELYSFCYFSETNVIVVQRNSDAGSPSKLASYLRDRGRCKDLLFKPILRADAMDQVRGMTTARRIELTVAVPRNLSLFDIEGEATTNVAQLAHLHGAAKITVILTTGQGHRHLNLQRGVDLLTKSIERFGKGEKRGQSGVTQAQIVGQQNALSPDLFIDLIEDRIVEEVEVGFTGTKPTMYDYIRHIKQAYGQRQTELLLIFPKAQE